MPKSLNRLRRRHDPVNLSRRREETIRRTSSRLKSEEDLSVWSPIHLNSRLGAEEVPKLQEGRSYPLWPR